MKKIVITAMVVGFVAVSAQASHDWINVGTGNWTDAANWNPDAPEAGDGEYSYIQNGGTAQLNTTAVTGARIFVGGDAAGESGTLEVGSGGNLTVGGYALFVGRAGSTGTVNINNGGDVTSARGLVGNSTSSTGTVTVDGAGSTWTVTETSNYDFILGDGNGSVGALNVLNGGEVFVDASFSRIGHSAGAAGAITVSGDGSTFIQDGWMLVGNSGAGTLTIADNGLISVTDMSIDNDGLNNDGVVRMSTYGQLALDGSASDLSGFLGLIAGTDNIDYWDGSSWTDITSGTVGVDYTITAGTGNLSGQTVLTAIPEPATLGLLGVASLGFLFMRRLRL